MSTSQNVSFRDDVAAAEVGTMGTDALQREYNDSVLISYRHCAILDVTHRNSLKLHQYTKQ